MLGALSGCSAGNPNLSAAEDAMEGQDYERALANIDTALMEDSADVEAYQLKAQILREMADSTMEPSEYKELYTRARAAEDSAVKYNPGARSDVEGTQTLTFTQEYQRGAKTFQQAQQSSDPDAFRRAASYFGAASATFPDSSDVILNESYALLNMERTMEDGNMANAIPVLEDYMEKTDEPQKNAYDILSALYLENDEIQKAIDLLERAREDLSSRPTKFVFTGAQGLEYTGEIQSDGGSESVNGTVPDEVLVEGEGAVTGTFEKQQEKGQMRVQLLYQGTPVQDTTFEAGSATLSADLSEETPLAELEGQLLNAYNQAGETEKAMEEYQDQIERNPENATYRYNYGSLLLTEDRFDEAIEQLQKAVDMEPGNERAQYNLGAAYTNKASVVQDSLRSVADSLSSIRDAAVEENREPTEEEEQRVNELDERRTALEEEKREIYNQAIPPLERARQLAGSGETLERDACQALVTAYVQTERMAQAKKLEDCAEVELEQQE